MEENLLRRRAEKITFSARDRGMNDDSLDEEFILLPGETFSCNNGTMTGVLFVGAIEGDENKNPEIQIWRNTGGTTYTRQDSQEIRLTEGDFSPDGVLQYNLTTPMSFQSGDVLGVYQPSKGDSTVRVYYTEASVTTYYQQSDNPMATTLEQLSPDTDNS